MLKLLQEKLQQSAFQHLVTVLSGWNSGNSRNKTNNQQTGSHKTKMFLYSKGSSQLIKKLASKGRKSLPDERELVCTMYKKPKRQKEKAQTS